MAHLMGPDFITLLVRDLEASRRFFAEVAGLPISPERQPNAVAFATQPIPFAIRNSPVDLDAAQSSVMALSCGFARMTLLHFTST